jgi:hypothetical protein
LKNCVGCEELDANSKFVCLWFGGGQLCVPTTDFNVQGS